MSRVLGKRALELPGEQADELSDLLPHGCGSSPEVVLEQFSDQALQDKDLPESGVGGQGSEQSDAVSSDGGGTAVALGGGGVATAQNRQGSVLRGREGGLMRAAAARGFSGCFSLLQVVFQQLFTGSEDFLQDKKRNQQWKCKNMNSIFNNNNNIHHSYCIEDFKRP